MPSHRVTLDSLSVELILLIRGVNRMAVLVVDSDQVFQESLINLLLICGVELFEVASNGLQALEEVSKKFFDIVLINLFLPDTAGWKLAEEIKKVRPTAKIILMLDDRLQPSLNKAAQAQVKFPTILKSSMDEVLPHLLAE